MTEEVNMSFPATSVIKVESALIESSGPEMGDGPSQSPGESLEETDFVKSPEVSPTELSSHSPGPSLAGNAWVARDADKLVAGCNRNPGSRNNSSMCLVQAASPPNFLTVPVAAAALPASTANGQVVVKSEPRDDIKDYVETTMNELLGWYGLPKMDKGDTHSVSLAGYPEHLPTSTGHPSPPAASITSQRRRKPPKSSSSKPTPANSFKYKSDDRRVVASSLSPSLPSPSPPYADSGLRVGAKNSNDTNNNSSHSNSHNSSKTDEEGNYEEEDELDRYDNPIPASDDEDTGDDMAHLGDSPSVRSDASGMISPLGGVSDNDRGAFIVCSWCQKPGTKLYTLKTSTGVKAFCSEVCFTQCRRASFKQKKVCDWCKHVRHTVNFVDFQEGDVQLQFCSEKCLNQYKMNIFCTEANQHLQHIQSIGSEDEKRTDGRRIEARQVELLITPELWLSGNSNESNVTVMEEVDDKKNENQNERSSERVKGLKKLEDAEEPGEIRDKRSAVDGSNRLCLSDDSSCSLDDKVGTNVSPRRLHRPRQELLHVPSSRLPLRPEDVLRPVGDGRQRKDIGKYRKPLTDHKSRSASSTSEQANVHPIRRENHIFPHIHAGDTKSTVGSLQGEAQASNPLLPDWAPFQLLSMMPPHINTGLSLGSSGFATNPLLYSNLFGVSPLTSATEKDTQAKLRHESRRELLIDKDRFTDQNDRKKDSREKTIVPSSPSTSLSSTDTTGHTNPALGLQPPSTINQNMFSELARHFPHTSAFLGEVNRPNPLSHYLSSATLPGMLSFPLNLNQPQNRGPVLITPTTTSVSASSTSHPQASVPPQPPLQFAGVPPITIMVPYPVAVPIPLPIPIPIPISPEKLFAYFREKSESDRQYYHPSNVSAQRARSPTDIRPRAASAKHLASPLSALSPRPASKCSSVSGVRLVSSPALTESPEHGLILPTGRESADSIITLREEISRSQLKAASTSPCTSSSIKVMISPGMWGLSKRACQESPHNEDEAMDLSKMSSRSDSPRRSTDSSEKENKSSLKRVSMSDTEAGDSQPTREVKVPRIHIISDPPDPPLSQPPVCIPLPMPPEPSSYSSRRSRILDAPSVPKKSRSPSPERRYVRTVPRELVEAARRRGLRARVRSK